MQYGWDLNEHMGWIGLSITNWNTFKQSVFQIYQTIVLLVICHIWNSHGAISGFKSIVVICIITCIRERAYATSSFSYNIGWPWTTAHNIVPHVILLEDVLVFITLRFFSIFPSFHPSISFLFLESRAYTTCTCVSLHTKCSFLGILESVLLLHV